MLFSFGRNKTDEICDFWYFGFISKMIRKTIFISFEFLVYIFKFYLFDVKKRKQ